MKEIELSKNGKKNKGKYKALVDDDIFPIVNQYDWTYYTKDYAYNSKMNILLHRYIWELKVGSIPEGLEVDHKDRKKLNCQIENLRLATRAENSRNKNKTKKNKSGYIGVSKHVQKKECQDGIHIHKYWNCQWQDNLGKQRNKNFPYDNVGLIQAARYYDIMTSQFAGNYIGELNFQSLSEYQKELSKAILKDIESNH